MRQRTRRNWLAGLVGLLLVVGGGYAIVSPPGMGDGLTVRNARSPLGFAIAEFNELSGTTHTLESLGDVDLAGIEHFNNVTRQWQADTRPYGNPPATCDGLAGWICAAHRAVWASNDVKWSMVPCLKRVTRNLKSDPDWNTATCLHIFGRTGEVMANLDRSNVDKLRALGHSAELYVQPGERDHSRSIGFAAVMAAASSSMLRDLGLDVKFVDEPDEPRAQRPRRKTSAREIPAGKKRARQHRKKTPCGRLLSRCQEYESKLYRLQRKGLANLTGHDVERYAAVSMQVQVCSEAVAQVRQLDLYFGEGNAQAKDVCRTFLQAVRSIR